jgi:hypothetical protein
MQYHSYIPLMVSRELGGMCKLRIWRGYVSSEKRRARNSFKAYSFDMLSIIIATFQFSYLSYAFCLPDIMSEKKKQETLS